MLLSIHLALPANMMTHSLSLLTILLTFNAMILRLILRLEMHLSCVVLMIVNDLASVLSGVHVLHLVLDVLNVLSGYVLLAPLILG
jgi:hypothetical protein